MTIEQELVQEFMEAMGHSVPRKVTRLEAWSGELKYLRLRLIEEEFNELRVAFAKNDTVEALDALMDLLYVVHGAVVCMGVDGEHFFNEVHTSNMLKLGEDGKPHYREDGKILKPEGWRPPDIAGELDHQERRLK